MQISSPLLKSLANAGWLLLTGLGIGWLVGLSVSPVVSIVITSVTGSAAAIIAAVSGVKEEFLDPETPSATLRRLLRSVTPIPLAGLVLGLALGTSTGVWARTHDWLSPAPESPLVVLLKDEIQQWVDLGMDKDEVVRAYFQSKFIANQPAMPATPNEQTPTFRDSILYATASPTECTSWQLLIEKGRYDDLAAEVASSMVKPYRELSKIVTNTVQLGAIVGEVLCANTQP